jgi:hypothetical protein
VWSNQGLYGHALGSAILAILEEVEQYNVQRTRCREVARKREVCDHVRRIHGMLATTDIARLRLLWWGKVWVDSPPLPIIEYEIYAQTFVKGHLCL